MRGLTTSGLAGDERRADDTGGDGSGDGALANVLLAALAVLAAGIRHAWAAWGTWVELGGRRGDSKCASETCDLQRRLHIPRAASHDIGRPECHRMPAEQTGALECRGGGLSQQAIRSRRHSHLPRLIAAPCTLPRPHCRLIAQGSSRRAQPLPIARVPAPQRARCGPLSGGAPAPPIGAAPCACTRRPRSPDTPRLSFRNPLGPRLHRAHGSGRAAPAAGGASAPALGWPGSSRR